MYGFTSLWMNISTAKVTGESTNIKQNRIGLVSQRSELSKKVGHVI